MVFASLCFTQIKVSVYSLLKRLYQQNSELIAFSGHPHILWVSIHSVDRVMRLIHSTSLRTQP